MDIQKTIIKQRIEEAVRNCNRNLYEWIEKGKLRKSRGVQFTISFSEVRGLVKNWITRCLRDTLGRATVNRALREGNLCISVNDNYISKLSMSTSDTWRSWKKDVDTIKECLEEIDYESLQYNPEDYVLDNLEPTTPDNPKHISFLSIEAIKF